MKLSFLLVAAACLAFAADTPSLSGNWQINLNVGGAEREQACTFTQKDKELTGSCNTDRGSVNLTGTVEDTKVSFKYKSEYNGSPLTVTFTGTLDSSAKIKGRVVVEEFGVGGEFTATQSK